ncbi:MAG: DUF192 domain-containing protein [Anaerolineales bacterium]|jgi:uncharacterized membrane protein (UPF0127 family)
MSSFVDIYRMTDPGRLLVRARWCSSFFCRLRGLTFRRKLHPGESLLLVDHSESRLNASIHMWMVFFPIGVIWLDSDQRVVDTLVARPWRVYLPAGAAQYILEGEPSIVDAVKVGEHLGWNDVG